MPRSRDAFNVRAFVAGPVRTGRRLGAYSRSPTPTSVSMAADVMRGGADSGDEAVIAAGPAHRWVETFERALVIAFALMVVNALVVSSPQLWTSWAMSGWVSRVGIALSVAALAASALWVAKSGPVRPVGWVVGGVCLSGQLMSAMADRSLATIPGGWWGVQHAIVVGVLIVGCIGGRSGTVAFFVFILAESGVLLVILEMPTDGVGPLWYLVVMCTVAAMIAGVVPAVRRTAALGDRAVQERIRAEAERESLFSAAKSLRNVAGLLHDGVAHALRACSLPPAAMSEDRVVDQCRAALRALDVAAQRQDLTERGLTKRITDVVEGSPIAVTLHAGKVVDPPVPVMVAIAAGVGEALRNVEKHAGIATATISIRPSRAGWSGVEVVVSDRGSGFDPNTIEQRRFGIRHSLQQRLRDVGAACVIDSTPGHGTAVHLRWAPSESLHSLSRLVDLAGARTAVVQAALAPFLVGAVIGLILHPQRLTHLAAALVTAAIAVVGIAAVVAVRWFTPDARWAAVITSVALIGLWLEASAWGWRAGAGAGYLLAALIGPALALLALYRPYLETWIALSAVTGSLGWLAHRTQPGLQWIPASVAPVLSPAAAVVAVLVFRSRIDRIAPLIAQSEAAAMAAHTQRTQLAALEQVGDQRISRIRAQVRPFLTAATHGRLDRHDAQFRAKAAALELAVRDDLQLGSKLNSGDRNRIEQARIRGASIEFNINDEADRQPTPLLSIILRTALSGSPQRLVITVTTTHLGTSFTIVISPAKSGTALTELLQGAGGTARGVGNIILLTMSTAVTARPSTCPVTWGLAVNPSGTRDSPGEPSLAAPLAPEELKVAPLLAQRVEQTSAS